jgi:PTH1 family peptidyl-tRNA hydrolase
VVHLVVGLGNPGDEYAKTRHNMGFLAIDKYLDKIDLKITKEKYGGKFVKHKISGEDVIFLKPQKYINLSGEVIKKFVDFYKIPLENILIIHDDLDLEAGTYKLRETGGSGGHNGLKNIEEQLGTKKYKRIRIGISKNEFFDIVEYVLGKPNKTHQKKIDVVINKVSDIINDYFLMNFSNLMNKYN